MRAEVAVVGLGPVGATLALLLARAGVEVVVVERDREVFPLSRAVALDDEALRVLHAAGLGAAEAASLFLTEQAVRFRSRRGATLVELPPRVSASGHPALAFFHQPEVEAWLRARLRAHPGVTLLLGHAVEALDQRGDGVTLRVRGDGGTRSVEAAWAVGCDGGRSFVRRALGIRLRGLTFARRWLVVDARWRGSAAPGPFEFFCDPARPAVTAPLPGGRQRWEVMLLPGEDPRAMEEPAAVRARLAPFADPDSIEVLRATAYTFHARVADRWRDRRVLLAGDAAHLSPPFAGQGLSGGLRDAHNLAWKLAAAVRGPAAPALLDTYAAERRPHAVALTALAVALGLVIQTRRTPVAAVRDAAARAILGVPAVHGWVTGGGWKPPSRYRGALVGPGGGAPFGHPVDDALGAGFALVGPEGDLAAALGGAEARALADALGVRAVPAPGAPLALVRPDRHVYAALRPGEAAATLGALRAALGGG